MTILIFRFSSAGDIVLTAPAVEALAKAYPQARLIYVTKKAYAPLLMGNPYISKIETFDKHEKFWQLVKRLKAYHPDVILDLHGKVRSFLLRMVLGCGKSVTWPKRTFAQRLGVRLGLKTFHANKTIVRRYHEAVEQLAEKTLPQHVLRYYVTENHRQEAFQLLQEKGVDLTKPIVGMSPSAMWQTKRWPKEHFAQLAQKLIAHNYQVVLSGSPSEQSTTQFIAEQARGTIDLQGQLSLGALGGFLEYCTAFIANDSGPMHIARGLQIPTLALFGSTDPKQFEFTSHALMYNYLPCSPCSFHGLKSCPKKHFRCMRDLTVEQAWQALQPLLLQKRAQPVYA